MSALISSSDSTNGGSEPIASSAVQPNSSSHAWFHTCTVPACVDREDRQRRRLHDRAQRGLAPPARRVDRAAIGDVARRARRSTRSGRSRRGGRSRPPTPGSGGRRRARRARPTSGRSSMIDCAHLGEQLRRRAEELVHLDARQRIVGADAHQLARGAVREEHAAAARVEGDEVGGRLDARRNAPFTSAMPTESVGSRRGSSAPSAVMSLFFHSFHPVEAMVSNRHPA